MPNPLLRPAENQNTRWSGPQAQGPTGRLPGNPLIIPKQPQAAPPPSPAPQFSGQMLPGLQEPAAGEEERISQRVPFAKNLGYDPHQRQDLNVGLEASRAAPEAFAKNAALIKGYKEVPTGNLRRPEALHERLIDHAMGNLKWLHDQMPPETRERASKWYDGANRIAHEWAGEFGHHPRQIAGALAALSPQRDWFQNVSLARRVLELHHAKGVGVTPGMNDVMERMIGAQANPKAADRLRLHHAAMQGKTLEQIEAPRARAMFIRAHEAEHASQDPGHAHYRAVTPEGDMAGYVEKKEGGRRRVGWGTLDQIQNAVAALQGNPDRARISDLMGHNHKVRNFYNNIIAPNAKHGDVTVDTHAIAAALLQPLAGTDDEVTHGLGTGGFEHAGTGTKGLYGTYAEAYRRLASDLGISPRRLQSITWEGVRGLFKPEEKRPALKGTVKEIHRNHARGEYSANTARERIRDAAGGFEWPTWQ